MTITQPAATPGSGSPWALSPADDRALVATLHAAVGEAGGPLAPSLLRVVGANGKRLRPALTFAVASLVPEPRDGHRVRSLAAAVELLHCATLVHDDLIDAAPTRRGVATMSAREGAPAAVVGGDLLISAAAVLAGRVSGVAGLLIAETLGTLGRGEAIQEQQRYDPDVTAGNVLAIASAKTAVLLRTACLLGADAAGADDAFAACVADFGLSFGVCLQLVDDLLDVVSTPALAGKPVGADFASGTVTLPAVLAMQRSPELRSLLVPGLDVVSRKRATALLQADRAALAATVDLAQQHADDAAERLDAVAARHPAARALAEWPRAYLERVLADRVGPAHHWLLARLP